MILSYIYIAAEKLDRASLRQAQSEAARNLLFVMLEHFGIRERKIDRSEYGRPFLLGREDIDFNISHSGELVVCVLSMGEGRVGVDVERCDPQIPAAHYERFAKRYLPKDKIKDGLDLAAAWTKKEAYLKYLGFGLGRAESRALPSEDERVRFESLRVGEYVITVCLGRDESVTVTEFPLRETEQQEEWG